ncbi:MAG: serine hydrolase [Acidimicrobiia bacterium]
MNALGGVLMMVASVLTPNADCPADPFTAERADFLDEIYPSQEFTAYVWDAATGCVFSVNPDNRQQTASVFKVMVMAGALLEAQYEERALSDYERGLIEPMISESANGPVRALWRLHGGAPWYTEQTTTFGLASTSVVGDYQLGWGRTTTTAADQVGLLRQVLFRDFGPLHESARAQAWGFMTDIAPGQRWGVGTSAPPGSAVAQKNGFAGTVANSIGGVLRSDGTGYAMAVLSSGWSSWPEGVEVVDAIAGWINESLGPSPGRPVVPAPDRWSGVNSEVGLAQGLIGLAGLID